MKTKEYITAILKEKILLLDGAMGTAIQSLSLTEDDFRGDLFRDHHIDLKGNNDILSITQPDHIKKIHEDYLEAGADIIETNTFNANAVSIKDYELEDFVYEMNFKSAELAVSAVKKYTELTPIKPRFAAGSIGPSGKTLSMSPDVEDPGFRSMTFDQMKELYKPQIRGLIDGGVDLLMVETVFDTLNAKAVLIGINEIFDEKKINIPIMLSVTVIDSSGRTLAGQTLDAFLYTIKHFDLFSIGLNCSLGAKEIFPYIKQLSELAPTFISLHPNAGLPNQFGTYDESPKIMGEYINEILEHSLVNIVGGCCGTTPAHIKEISHLIENKKIREIPVLNKETVLSGLEILKINKDNNFINIGERTNIYGSKKFARLIKEEKYEKALSIARSQITGGAQLLDINMDDPMIDQKKAIVKFLNLIGSEPDIIKFPIMIDSSDWDVLEAGLKSIQGKAVINSISLKEGEEIFKERAKTAKLYGAAIIVMAFDEEGQAASYERKIEICKRSYDILTKEVLFPAEDIIFDANILTIATGMKEHNYYADNYIKAVQWIKENLPYAKTSGGISNLSFAFRGNDLIREAIHSVFLLHAINAGLDMGIVNSTSIQVYDDIPKDLIKLIETVLFNPTDKKIEELIEYASNNSNKKKVVIEKKEWREFSIEEKLVYSLIHGIKDHADEDIDEALKKHKDAVYIIEVLLMNGMRAVGDLFDKGKMFLPQVIKSARVMKIFVDILMPEIIKNSDPSVLYKKKKVIIATVKGDVHDIGKNIISLILSCNQFEMIDLGVMVPVEKILSRALEEKADLIGVSGLITPSLEEMAVVASEMERRKFTIPLLIGGAATTELHTAVKLDHLYSHPVIYVPDASKSVQVASKLVDKKNKLLYINELKKKYIQIRENYKVEQEKKTYISIGKARANKTMIDWSTVKTIKAPTFIGNKFFLDTSIDDIIDLIDWTFFFIEWNIKGKYPDIFKDKLKGAEAKKLYDDAIEILEIIKKNKSLSIEGVIGLYPANSIDDDIEIYKNEERKSPIHTFNFLRNQSEKNKDNPNRCLADYVASKESGVSDYLGFFALTAGIGIEKLIKEFDDDEYKKLMVKILSHRLAEAYAELLHQNVRKNYWGYENNRELNLSDMLKSKFMGIRPAPGYPTCPDHRAKGEIFDLLNVEKNISISLTEHFAMTPSASICGYYFANPDAKYFNVGKISKDQIENYSNRRNEPIKTTEKWFKNILNY